MSFNFLLHIAMEHTQESHQKKRFNEEETLDKAEKKIDDVMEKIVHKWSWIIHKFLSLKVVKDVLASHFITDINNKLHPYIATIFTVIWWISIITWIIGVFSFLVSLSGIGFMFSLWFGIGLRVLVYILVAIVFSLLSLFIGIGLLRHKKRVISLVIFGLAVSAFSLLVSLIPVWLYSAKSYGSFWWGLFNIIVTAIIVALVLKNEHMFTK